VEQSAAHTLPHAHVLPHSAGVDDAGRLTLGGIDVRTLAERFGTPLYVYDAETVRRQCQSYLQVFRDEYPDCSVLYASKAFLNRPFARFIADQGLGFDAVSGGELSVLAAAGVDMSTVYLHGNNKSFEELFQAVRSGVGRVVIDNEHDVELLERACAELNQRQQVMLRVSPAVDAHTHQKTTTGILDTKFGVALGPVAKRVIGQIAGSASLDFRGLHMHLGSPIFSTEPYTTAIDVVSEFIAECRDELGVEFPELSPGGGFPVAYTDGQADDAPPLAMYAGAIAQAIHRGADRFGFEPPSITIEPGRSIAARAGVALYSAGSRKEIEGVRTYVSVDGGMADNIRPAMYGASYVAVAAERPLAPAEERVTVAGKYCESGDLLIQDAELPRLRAGELLAIPASGAYHVAMESNYNLAYRPAIVMVDAGEATLIRRRQTAVDLMALDVD
jgi:diaminopimelate decarboxylase